MTNELEIIKFWLMFGFGATDVEFEQQEFENNLCKFSYNDKHLEFDLQYIYVDSDSFLYNINTFKGNNKIQITPNYFGIVIADKVKRHLVKYKQFITKDKSGYMKVPYKIAEEVVHIVKLEEFK